MKPVILTFVGCYLPGFKAGGPIQTIANMVDRLGDEFDFRIITSDRDLGDVRPYDSVEVNTFVPVGKANVFYASPEMMRLSNLKHLINEIHYDILYLNSFFNYSFTIQPLILRRLNQLPNKPVIVAPRGEFSEGAIKRRWSKWIKKRIFLAFAKSNNLYNDITWQASSDYEKYDIQKYFGGSAIVHIAPDLTPHFRDKENDDIFKQRKHKEKDLLKVIFISRISPMKNLDGALRIIQKVKGRIEMNIFGPVSDEAYWETCKKIIKQMPENVTVTYRGSVPHNEVPKTIAEHDLFFLPTLGENFGHAIIEALSVGTPVLISDRTPWRNLEKHRAGWDYPLEDENKFINRINNLINLNINDYRYLNINVLKFYLSYSTSLEALAANRNLFSR